jgi:hypothetical protein
MPVALRLAVLAVAAAALTACAAAPPAAVAPPADRLAPDVVEIAPLRSFGPPRPMPPQRSNTEIARDFLDLTFKLESGTDLPVMTRFDEPVTVALAGRTTSVFSAELDRLVGRLRSEARLDIVQLPKGSTAAITIEGVLRHDMQRLVPGAACFVLPARITWAEFRANPRGRNLNWTDLRRREAATVFIPSDISPQEVRDCLHEEVAQALGPLNDLYRLEDSVFNDDNMHSVLTGFDMLVLRITYDPALANGMTRPQVAAALPAILARLNPAGATYATRPYQPSPRSWVKATERALTPGRIGGSRRGSANEALRIAQDAGWNDTRLGLSLLTVGRLSDSRDGEAALSAFLGASQVYGARPATAVHEATVGVQIAAFALASGELDTALRIADRYVPVAEQAENATLLTDLEMVRAAALDGLGRPLEARQARAEAQAWGRYGLRDPDEVRERTAEIAALVPTAKERI